MSGYQEDDFWVNNPRILIAKNRLVEFVPTGDMTTNEQLNAIARFGLYLGVLLTIIYRDINMIYITLVIGVLTQFISEHYYVPHGEGFNNSIETQFQQPTNNNPFMNVLLTDINKRPERKPAADLSHPIVKAEVEQGFNKGLYRDINNIWDRNNSQRQFYTTPSTTVPNDRDSFMKWCYNVPDGCKDGNQLSCLKNEDIRYQT